MIVEANMLNHHVEPNWLVHSSVTSLLSLIKLWWSPLPLWSVCAVSLHGPLPSICCLVSFTVLSHRAPHPHPPPPNNRHPSTLNSIFHDLQDCFIKRKKKTKLKLEFFFTVPYDKICVLAPLHISMWWSTVRSRNDNNKVKVSGAALIRHLVFLFFSTFVF